MKNEFCEHRGGAAAQARALLHSLWDDKDIWKRGTILLVGASVSSAHPFMPFPGFQLLNTGLISSEVMEIMEIIGDRAQQTRVKGLYYT